MKLWELDCGKKVRLKDWIAKRYIRYNEIYEEWEDEEQDRCNDWVCEKFYSDDWEYYEEEK
jgi:hypothetical protein